MSGIAYPPPTEILPIFDESVFNVDQNVALTEQQANLLYLKFPTAQGTETFGDIFVNGNATLNCPVQINSNLLQLTGTSSIQFPDLSTQTTAYTGTAGVASSVVVANGGVGQTYLALTQGTGGPFPILTNTPQYNATSGVLSAPQFTGSLNGNATTATTANISSNSAISSGGSGSMYLALTQGTGGNFPIQTNIPTYDATLLVLTAPIFNGTTYITSPLLTTSPNGTVRIASTTGQYSYFQQNDISTTSNLNLYTPSAGLFHINVGGVANLPPANDSTTGLSIGWNSQNGDGNTDFINHAQGSTTGGFKFFNVSGSTPTTLIAQIPKTQPAFGDTSPVSIPTNSWVNGTITSTCALLNSSNIFTQNNLFNNLCPQTPIAPTVNNSLTNKLYVDTSISNAIIGSGSASLGGANVFTAQNTFNNFAPETPIAPTVNNSLVNLQYLNTQIASLRTQIPLRAVESFSPLSGDYINTLTINSWANYLVNEFITIRYTLSNNYPYTDTITASTNTANSTGYVDIYPYRLGFGNGAPIGQVLNFNVLNNTLNGSSAYNMNSTQLRGRWFWAYNQSNLNAPANGFYLYIQNITSQVLDIGLYVASPSAGNPYSTSFTVELVSSIDSSKITTSNFNVSNF